MADYLWRLALVLPLILLAVVALLLLLHRRRGGALPGLVAGLRGPGAGAVEPLVVRVQALAPNARVAVIRFAGRDHLVGIAGSALQLMVSSEAAGPGSAMPGRAPAAGEERP